MKKNKKIRIGIILIATLLVYFSYITIEQEKLLNAKNTELSNIQTNIQEEKKMKAKLNEQLQNVNTEEYIVKAARQKLGLVKEGERVFVDVNK